MAMGLLKIARMGHPVLLQETDAIEMPVSENVRRLAADMVETMHDAMGVGLAAPQVHQALRMFVYHVPAERNLGMGIAPRIMINPEIVPDGEGIMECEEGCLSIPGLRGLVPRYSRVRYHAAGLDGEIIAGIAEGFHANVLQHEFDHLNGILYPMRMTDFSRLGFVEELRRYPWERRA